VFFVPGEEAGWGGWVDQECVLGGESYFGTFMEYNKHHSLKIHALPKS